MVINNIPFYTYTYTGRKGKKKKKKPFQSLEDLCKQYRHMLLYLGCSKLKGHIKHFVALGTFSEKEWMILNSECSISLFSSYFLDILFWEVPSSLLMCLCCLQWNIMLMQEITVLLSEIPMQQVQCKCFSLCLRAVKLSWWGHKPIFN